MNFCSGKRDEVTIKVQESRGSAGVWWFYQQQVQSETILTLCSPADAAIGQYHLVVLIMSPDGHTVGRKDDIEFHLLFNPWCKGKKSLHFLLRCARPLSHKF